MKTSTISQITEQPRIEISVELPEDGYQAMIHEIAMSGLDYNEFIRQAIAQRVAQAQNLRRMQEKLLSEAA